MIHYLWTGTDRVFHRYLASHGAELAPRFRILAYQQLFQRASAPAGSYVFADFERLSPLHAEGAARIWSALERSGRGLRLLNHPTRSRRRYELLRLLHEQGANAFDAQLATEARRPERFPVFVRDANEHRGNLTPLLHTQAELDAALAELDEQGRSREALLVVGFCDTADARGVYRKYSAFYVAGRVIPRHLFFGEDWVIKWPVLMDPALLEEERAYVEENPHEKEIRRVFELARIDYGRIDYALLEGRMQVWEINSHPYVSTPRDGGGPQRSGVSAAFLPRFSEALRRLDAGGPSRPRIAIPRIQRPRSRLQRMLWRRLPGAVGGSTS